MCVKLLISLVCLVGASLMFLSPVESAYADSPLNCGVQSATVTASSIQNALSNDINDFQPNSCFAKAYSQCDAAVLTYDLKASSLAISARLTTLKVADSGCATSLTIDGLSMTCVLDNNQSLLQALENTESQSYANCSGPLVYLLPKTKITYPTASAATASTTSSTAATPVATSAIQTTALVDTGSSDIVPIFLVSSLAGLLVYRRAIIRSKR